MRGIYSNKTEIRHKVFTEIARMAYDDSPLSRIEDLPYEIVPEKSEKYYDNIFWNVPSLVNVFVQQWDFLLERCQNMHLFLKELMPAQLTRNTTIPHLLTLLSLHAMHVLEKRVFITNACQGCLEHPCIEVCPKDAIKMVKGRSVIDQDKCIKCGKCASATTSNGCS